MAVKDGLPATDFSRMNREWVKAVAGGGSGGGGIPAPENPSDGDVLTYSSADDEWVAAAPSGGGGATIINPTIGQYDPETGEVPVDMGITVSQLISLLNNGMVYAYLENVLIYSYEDGGVTYDTKTIGYYIINIDSILENDVIVDYTVMISCGENRFNGHFTSTSDPVILNISVR